MEHDPNTPSAQLARVFAPAISEMLPDGFSAALIIVNIGTGDIAVDTIRFESPDIARAVLRAAVEVTEDNPPMDMSQDPIWNPDVRPEWN